MTLRASDPRVLAFQLVARLIVIEIVGIETKNLKIQPIMFGVAARAILRPGLLHDAGMVSTMRVNARSNFSMAVHTLQRNRPAKLVAGGTLRDPVERLMRLRQRPRRDLRAPRRREHRRNRNEPSAQNGTAHVPHGHCPECSTQPHSPVSLRDMTRARLRYGLTP